MIFDRIMLPAQGRNEDYKFAQTGSVRFVGGAGGAGGAESTPSWLENVIKLDPESEFLSVDNWHVKGDLVIEGQVNQWLAQQLVVDDARIQVNRKQDGVVVDSGLVIFDKDTKSEVSSLLYDISGVWKAGGSRLFTEDYNPKLGGYVAGDYPRKSENAVVTGAWTFDNDLTIGGGATRSIFLPSTKIRDNNSKALIFSAEGGGVFYFRPDGDGFSANQTLIDDRGLFTGAVIAGGNVGGAGTFVGGFAGSGWRLEAGAENHLTVDRLSVRGRMDIYELVVNQIRGTNGALWVTDSAKISSVSGNRLTIDTKGSTSFVPFVVNDLLRCQRWTGKNVKYYVVRVTAVGSNYIDVALVAGSSPREAGDYLVRMGNTSVGDRQGALYLTSSDSNAPYMDVLDGVNSASFANKTKVRIGRLDGIVDPDLGALSGYGLYTQNGFFKGKVTVTGGNAATKQNVNDSINNIKIGGRNLLKWTTTGDNWLKTSFDKETLTFTRETTGTEAFVALVNKTGLEKNTTYTLSAWVRTNGQVKNVDFYCYDKGVSNTHSKKNLNIGTEWQFVTFTFTTNDADYTESTIRFDNNGSKTAGVNAILYIKQPKLERGNKATDWTPAPEDVPSALNYLTKALQGTTEIEGGIINTNVLMVKDTKGKVTGGMSGLKSDNVGFWTGGSYQDAINNNANVIFRKDGSFSLSKGKITGTTAGTLSIDGGVVTGEIKSSNYDGTIGSLFDLENGNLKIGNAINIDSFNSEILVKDRETGNYIMKIGDFPLSSIYNTLYNFDKVINSQSAFLSPSSGAYAINGNVYLDSINRSDVLLRSSTTSTQYYLVNNLTVGNSYKVLIAGIKLKLMVNSGIETLPDPYPFSGFSGGYIKVQLKNGSKVLKEYIYSTKSDGIRLIDDILLNFTAESTNLQLVITPVGDFYHHSQGANNTTIVSNCSLAVERETEYNSVMLYSQTSAIELSTKGLQVAFSANSYFTVRSNYAELRTTQMLFSENEKYGLRIDDNGVYIKRNGGAWTAL